MSAEKSCKMGELKLSDSAQVDDEFLKLWRSVTVDAMDDAKIDEYLEKQGGRADNMSHNLLYLPLPLTK